MSRRGSQSTTRGSSMSYTSLLKMYELYQGAEAAYDDGRHAHAAELYRQAMRLAETSDVIPAWYRALLRRAYADELIVMERLREGLAALAALPKEDAEGVKSCCVYGNLTDHIRVAQRLPVSLRTLERAYEQAEDYSKGAGDASWRSRLLYYRSELHLLRGEDERALAVAQEGFAVWRKDCPKLYGTTHLYQLFEICLALRDEPRAARYLERWRKQNEKEEKRSRLREATERVMESLLERLRGRPAEAVERARLASHLVSLADWGATRYEVQHALVRALLAAGRHEAALSPLAQLAHLRRSESALEQYRFQLLRGDYHLARARDQAGLAPFDDELGHDSAGTARDSGGPRVRAGAGRSAADDQRRQLSKARAAYAAALRVGRWVDERLECGLRRRCVAERLSRVEAVAARGA